MVLLVFQRSSSYDHRGKFAVLAIAAGSKVCRGAQRHDRHLQVRVLWTTFRRKQVYSEQRFVNSNSNSNNNNNSSIVNSNSNTNDNETTATQTTTRQQQPHNSSNINAGHRPVMHLEWTRTTITIMLL